MKIKLHQILVICTLLNVQIGMSQSIFKLNVYNGYLIKHDYRLSIQNNSLGEKYTIYNGQLKDTLFLLDSNIERKKPDFSLSIYKGERKKIETPLKFDIDADTFRINVNAYDGIWKEWVELEVANVYSTSEHLSIIPNKDFVIGDYPIFFIENLSPVKISNYRSDKALNGIITLPDGEVYHGKYQTGLQTAISKCDLAPGDSTIAIVGVYDPYKFSKPGTHSFQLIYTSGSMEQLKLKRLERINWYKKEISLHYQRSEFQVD